MEFVVLSSFAQNYNPHDSLAEVAFSRWTKLVVQEQPNQKGPTLLVTTAEWEFAGERPETAQHTYPPPPIGLVKSWGRPEGEALLHHVAGKFHSFMACSWQFKYSVTLLVGRQIWEGDNF